ncbi:MAG: ATP-dependent protease subunit HslV [Sphingobacteriia bacterium]|nr:ATP-dependent protease subunit HslV [Sphingobacteriia bacterium]
MPESNKIHSTTVLGILHQGQVVLGADGQATFGQVVMKSNVKKVRKIAQDQILTGFAGSTADAFTLLERFEEKLSQHGNNMKRASIELARDWRSDRYLRRLEAMMIVMNAEEGLVITGGGDVLEPDHQILAIGSGAMYAQSAALALKRKAPHLTAEEIVRESLGITADICIYTNHQFEILSL